MQRALIFEPAFHDADALLERVPAALVRYDELNRIGAAIPAAMQVSQPLQDYVHRLWLATRDPVAAGVNIAGVDMPRLVAAWLAGRGYVVPEDVQAVFAEALRHRIFFTPVYEMRRAQIADALVAGILARVTAP